MTFQTIPSNTGQEHEFSQFPLLARVTLRYIPGDRPKDIAL